MEIRYDPENSTLTVTLPKKVTGENHKEVRDAIMAALDQAEADGKELFLYLDAEETEYMSSVGLRIIILVQKRVKNVAVINVQTSLYEILAMTGLDQIGNVFPPFRTISLEGCEEIGRGRNSRLYRMDEDKVCKVFEPKNTLEDVIREKRMSRMALRMGIPTALSFQVVRTDNSFGVVYELLNSYTLSELFRKEPEKIDLYIRNYVRFMKQIHSIPAPDMPDMKDIYRNKVIDPLREILEPEYWESVVRIYEQIPEGNGFVHCDPHFANLFLSEDGFLLVDLDTAARGDEIWDLAALYSTMIGFQIINREDVMHMENIETYPVLWEKVFDEWIASQNMDRKQTGRTASVISLAGVLNYAARHHFEEELQDKLKTRLRLSIDAGKQS
ncbi:MAG: phosphotransferase [Blautia sp.]|nr:phosphotransferase [Blautia sp.]